MATNSTYYQGDLRQELLAAAVAVIDEKGIGSLSLREVARRVGVSHAAPAHHFGDKAGLFTALATDSFHLFADAMKQAIAQAEDPLSQLRLSGIAYIEFAIKNRSRFEVMFRPEVLNCEDVEYLAASRLTLQLQRDTVAGVAGSSATRAPSTPTEEANADVVLATWGLVHGLATLLNQGNLPGLTTQEDQLRAAIGALSARPVCSST